MALSTTGLMVIIGIVVVILLVIAGSIALVMTLGNNNACQWPRDAPMTEEQVIRLVKDAYVYAEGDKEKADAYICHHIYIFY